MLENNGGYGEISQNNQELNTPAYAPKKVIKESKTKKKISEENQRTCHVRREIERRKDEKAIRDELELS